MKLWLDDIREAPEGWTHVKNAFEFQVAIKSGPVEEVSFDNDLGSGQAEGWEIANWLLGEVVAGRVAAPLKMNAHSMNPVARERIRATIRDIHAHSGRE